jgi:hypothetical protein
MIAACLNQRSVYWGQTRWREGNMAKNTGLGRRIGAVSGRSQFELPSGHPAKRDTQTGRIISVKSDKASYKGVRKEK